MLKNKSSFTVLQHVHNEQIADFHQRIEAQVDQGVDILEAIVAVCEEKGIEVEDAVPFLSNKIVSDLHQQCLRNNLVDRKHAPRVDLQSILG